MSVPKIRAFVLSLIGAIFLVFALGFGSSSAETFNQEYTLLATNSSSPIHVVGRVSLVIPNEARQEYKQRTEKLFELTNKIDKPALYTCNQDINDPQTFVWDEEWSSYEHLQTHLNSDHFNEWWNYSKQFLKGKLQVQYAEISDFHAV